MSSDRLLRRSENSTRAGARTIYQQLIDASWDDGEDTNAREFLEHQLEKAEVLACDMPLDPSALEVWMEQQVGTVGRRYAEYLQGRQFGGPRQYFSCRSHALWFLQGVAPTKLVDGSWLYGLLRYRHDERFYALIRTYLEELGEGDAARNHVLLYRRLLNTNGCEAAPALSDQHYVQGAIQLALARHTGRFLPEVIGYNLGYEQLPLHLLITAFELSEQGIDPYYFTLHVTIDNASTGHARKAVQSVIRCLPNDGSASEFMARVGRGYRLNELGLGTTEVISRFDLDREVIATLERKAVFGNNLHSDYCRIGGHTVNDWLSQPRRLSDFLAALEGTGWIKRNEDPSNSRFWNLIEGPRAAMAGVFSGYEKQLLRDWIMDEQSKSDGVDGMIISSVDSEGKKRRRSFRPYRQSPDHDLEKPVDEEAEFQTLQAQQSMDQLVKLMAPSTHTTPAGLWATRMFSAVFQ